MWTAGKIRKTVEGPWILKEKLPQAFMQIEWMENGFRNLTAKVWANLDNPIKSYDFSKFWLNSCMPPSQHCAQNYLWCHNNYCLMELYTNFNKKKKITFHENAPSLYFFYLGILGLRWLRMHLWLNLINWTIDIQAKKKKKLWNSMYKVNEELFSCDIIDSGKVLSRGRTYKTLHN